MQTVLVIITFCLAAGFLLKKFVWNPIVDPKGKSSRPLKGDQINCGDTNCGCK